MNLLQALFFPPEQPGGVSSMIPYLQERFRSSRWEMDLFWLPKRIRGKGREEIVFETLTGHSTAKVRLCKNISKPTVIIFGGRSCG